MPMLVSSQAYTRRVIKVIQHARKRVYVLALIIQQDNDASEIITALARAAHRGVDVHVIGDSSTYSFAQGHLNPYYGYREAIRNSREMTNRSRSHNITFDWVGRHSPFLFAGRTHCKWIVADDTVFTFGGINLHEDFASDSDYMFEIKDTQIAQVLVAEHQAIVSADKVDTAYPSIQVMSSYGNILIDGGMPLDSTIYRSAVSLAQTAKDILVVTQYCPTGALAKAIRATNYQVYFNSPQTKDPLTNWLIATGQKLSGITNSYTKDPYIHAKFLIATGKDGVKTAITGSHNFISYGGILGTREIALQTQDTNIIATLEQYHQKYIA